MKINGYRETPEIRNFAAHAPSSPDKTEENAQSSDAFIKQQPSDEHLKKALLNVVSNESKVLQAEKTKILSDSYGRVTHLALMLSDYVGGESRKQVLDAYGVLFSKMEPDTKFSIVVDSDRDKADIEKVIKRLEIPNPERIQFIEPKEHGLTVWARDMMVGMFTPGDPSHTALLKQSMLHNWHENDNKVPEIIVEANPSILIDREPRIVTDGGDVMSNRNESFVGFYSLAATASNIARISHQNPSLKQKIVSYYENNFGKEVIETKNSEVLPYKFEMSPYPSKIHRFLFRMIENPGYVSPAIKEGQASEGQMYEDIAVKLFERQFGKPVTVMGKDDPATPNTEEPATDHMDMGLTPVDEKTFFLGDPKLLERIITEMTPQEQEKAENAFSKMAGRPISLPEIVENSRNRDNPADFDAYEKTLKSKGYDVIRMPHSEPDWYGPYISYNNCLMERFEKDGGEVKRVFLPQYGVEKLDGYARKTFEDQGFTVFPIKMDALSSRWGALRCISNWLDRSPRG